LEPHYRQLGAVPLVQTLVEPVVQVLLIQRFVGHLQPLAGKAALLLVTALAVAQLLVLFMELVVEVVLGKAPTLKLAVVVAGVVATEALMAAEAEVAYLLPVVLLLIKVLGAEEVLALQMPQMEVLDWLVQVD
jgi:hypothetical protein